ncbi:class I adenylate-forming enzyme family protein [Nocardioides sp. LHG3406-4]|uniref:class I adenylate-forming enzyme family protein n=1 Tax=Nocardioides sp. LHG3406-4 TaxID=2804575 RepID=UPI003CEEED07
MHVELDRPAAERLASGFLAGLHQRGIGSGAMVAFSSPNSPELLAAVFACLRARVAPVVLSASLTSFERHDMLRDLPIALVVDDESCTSLARTPVSASTPRMDDSFACRPLHFTSGTSGRPKAVWSGWLDASASAAATDEERAVWGFEPTDRHLVNAPLSHSAPLRFALNTLLHGGTVLLPRRFDTGETSGLLSDAGVTTTFMAPAHLQRVLAQAPPRDHSLRLLAHAGSACPTWVKHAAIDRFGASVVTEFYGSTEGQFTVCASHEWLERPGTVGRARPGRELKTVDDQIWCRTPLHARFEYWGDPDKTAAAWDGDWFTVGDLGRIDADGYLYLEGRRGDLVITGGVNVYPAEVERVLGELTGVDKVCVVGVDDERWGQRVCAALTGEVTDAEVRAYAEAHLAPYKRPKTVLVADALPLTHSGKVDRLKVAALLAAVA